MQSAVIPTVILSVRLSVTRWYPIQKTAHTASVGMSAAVDCGYILLLHPPYLPDRAPSDFYLFPMLKDHLRGKQFSSDNDVIQSVDDFLQVQDKQVYQTGIQELQKRWHKCIEGHRDYVEK